MRFSDDIHRAFEDDGREDPELAEELDEEFPLGDGTAETEATVLCPYCGEPVEIALDPGGGSVQDYVEDCEVCCQPWRVSVVYHEDGSADVRLVALDD
ncbi:MAG TPA: CPXCG motif-containing cysteine-rich protein [Gemmatimonadaceae bacterium]|nr:CPXCG motif-containing cysteine-rich protein [Gemmatimonadaceae bacterium]